MADVLKVVDLDHAEFSQLGADEVSGLSDVATSNDYGDLDNKPSLAFLPAVNGSAPTIDELTVTGLVWADDSAAVVAKIEAIRSLLVALNQAAETP